MTQIKKTLDKTNEIITNLITKLDLANLGGWTEEKQELTKLLTYLNDKTQPKPTGTEEITLDLGEIENLQTDLQTLTEENTRLTTENTNLQTKNSEQDSIIKSTTIPDLIAKLEQFASKVSASELKTALTEIITQLTNLKKAQEETKSKVSEEATLPTNYWSIGSSILGGISVILLGYIAFFKSPKKEKAVEIIDF